MRFSILILFAVFASVGFGQPPCDVSVVVAPPTCPGDADGSITVVPGDGGPFIYTWDHDPTLDGPTATGLVVGPYTVTVMGADGCISIIDTVVVDPIVAPLGTMVTSDITCAGNGDGSVTFTVAPGPYTWQWIDDPTETSPTRNNLGPGDYTVLVSGGTCPSYVTGTLGDPGVVIGGEATYCPSEPPVLTADVVFGFQPDSYLWSTGETTPAINVAIGTIGLISVTATNTTTGCSATADITLDQLPAPTVLFTAPDSLCIRSGGDAHTTLSDADSLVWRWGTTGFSNELNPIVLFDTPFWQPISLQGFDASGCGSAPVEDSVFVRPRIPAVFTAAQIPCTSILELQFNSAADSCAFFVGDSLRMNTCLGTYQLDLRRYQPYDITFYSTQPNLCDDTSSVFIDVRTPPILPLPNAFTPNGDGINDTWPGPIELENTNNYEVELFDRWGHSLWVTTDTQMKWDGAAQPDGVYVYVVNMRDPCEPTRKVTKNGFVTMVR